MFPFSHFKLDPEHWAVCFLFHTPDSHHLGLTCTSWILTVFSVGCIYVSRSDCFRWDQIKTARKQALTIYFLNQIFKTAVIYKWSHLISVIKPMTCMNCCVNAVDATLYMNWGRQTWRSIIRPCRSMALCAVLNTFLLVAAWINSDTLLLSWIGFLSLYVILGMNI